jgi:CheY-like chemotaxis protein
MSIDDISTNDSEADIEIPRSLVYVFSADPDYAQQLAASLEVFEHDARAFNDENELKSATHLRQPSAVVIDIDSELGQATKSTLGQTGLSVFPVIYLSSQDNFEQRLAAVREGAAGYYIKPLDVESLSLKIDERIADNEVSAYRVLVVDDDETMIYFYDAVLSSAEMRVKTLTDPSEILEVMKSFKPELLLLDINMPVCSGLELAKIIRQNNHYLDIPIVFLSGDSEKQLQAIETGADDFLSKPIDPEVLISAIAHRAARYRTLRKGR